MLSHARLSILSNVVRNYSATTAAESTAAVESTVDSLLAALLPQDAKDTAANATNKNTNFFIFFAF